jgi:hypothetical protein
MELDDSTMEDDTSGLNDFERLEQDNSPPASPVNNPRVTINTATPKLVLNSNNNNNNKSRKNASIIKQLIDWYLELLSKFPIPTKMLTSAFVQFCGSIVSQKFVRKMKKIDWHVVFKFVATGALVSPASHFWFQNLDKIMRVAGPQLDAINKQSGGLIPARQAFSLALDQLVFAPFLNVLFISYLALFDNQASQIPNNLRRDLWPTLTKSWMVWPFTSYFNLNYVPSHLRVLFGNFVGFFWSIYLSYSLK